MRPSEPRIEVDLGKDNCIKLVDERVVRFVREAFE